MPDQTGFEVPAKFLQDMADVKKIVLGSSRTKNRKFRRRRNPGGGVGGSGDECWARVKLADIYPAASNLLDDWEDGNVTYVDDATGKFVGAVDSPTVAVKNRTRDYYPIDAQVRIDLSKSPPEILYGSCGQVVWEEEYLVE